MLTIRLSRVGKKKAPLFRVIVQPKTRDPWAKSIEILGHYNPRTKALVVAADQVKHWLEKGAQCSPTVWNLFLDHKFVEGKKIAKSHISDRKKADLEKDLADKKAKEDAAKAKAEAAKLAEEEAKKAAAEAAKAEAEAAKAEAEKPAEAPAPTETPAE
ncbi:30S ribosomal protein S16 [Candidatus Uhrbacteria bacterium RIFCSPHIGHO2_02_FULL_47_44]|uniref:Small ribosomal subunit protein bS16 n=1 Tax=Candidatus Uhrbacteria bacterium RIFCSPLOWO2_02_FULL_48_18 TaxID=1802408 RepID=A0A1F7VCF7_9BACT|nr:MAG: 30S ribosomal protein S16 [Candidatus Uhrbacteria bacterium RIFCSPHIGHO2_01_FULL_47_10]OGL71815.1 MAG: 30S ribosomal protein S16 [Candidatus Uhrbacteria bacterium RIFCSPHIGHO2_02_FULL_47_44]OGL80611.1 MAG: 30S ribosomal protein S16 [Candidatus Uhrbacteria bacterium RIFCSPLOWO2_01_FULL_47_17]OGL88206.1 MAG: 30S ribosomal protein S16 [Candidatus Uhrbacteria bacterium RIFCSPLOWO2_02_FULL_48_18]